MKAIYIFLVILTVLALLLNACNLFDANSDDNIGNKAGETMTQDNPVNKNSKRGLCKFDDGSNDNWNSYCK